MKVLYIVPDITDSGGIARVVSLKTNYLVEKLNYEICFISVSNSISGCFYDFNPGIKWYSIKPPKNKLFFILSYFRFIKKIISTEKPDIIVVCDAVLWLFIPWCIKVDVPMIFETHFPKYFEKVKTKSIFNSFRNRIVRFLKKLTITKFTNTVFVTEEGSKEWNLNKSKVITNPLSFKVAEGASLVNKKVLAVCMNPYVKGLDRLLVIWKQIIEIHPDWILDVYGDWDVNYEYLNEAKILKIEKNINFIFPTNDIYNSYIQSSIFLMTSRHESFGMVLIESMAIGVPCIAYNGSVGPRTIIKDGLNGFLIEDGNVASYVHKLKNLIEDDNLRFKLGNEARRTVEKHDIDVVMKEWENLFTEVVGS